MNKYEQLIEHIINDETDKARELFHTIVVEKSRDIYESLIDETDLEEVGGNQVHGLIDEIEIDERGISEDDDEDELEVGDDGAEDDLDFDNSGDLDDHEEEHGDVEGRVQDLEAALDELKAEFDALMAGEEAEEEQFPGIHGEEDGEEFDSEEEQQFFESEEDEEEDEELDESIVREYVEKVSAPSNKTEGGEVGKAGSANINKQSIVAKKNDMGGTATNIVKGGAEATPDGTTPKSNAKTKGQLIGKVQNTAGGSKSLSSANKPKSGEGQTTDGKVPVSAKSPLAK